MPIERPLLDILACPIDKKGLLYFADEAILYNPRLRRLYRITDSYLVMLADRAEPASESEHQRLLARAGHGEAVGTSGLVADALALALAHVQISL
ncbi:MAG TPA: Trm112 family protein [Streptosporangiaceae bacterium]